MEKPQRTDSQNRAIHLWLEQTAKVLRENGIDMKTALKYSVDIMPTKENLKEVVWRPIQESMYGKKSTTELKTDQVSDIYDIIVKHFAEHHHVTLPPFPSLEN
jgi:hypothetical protein